jgi:hypothetical protein
MPRPRPRPAHSHVLPPGVLADVPKVMSHPDPETQPGTSAAKWRRIAEDCRGSAITDPRQACVLPSGESGRPATGTVGHGGDRVPV